MQQDPEQNSSEAVGRAALEMNGISKHFGGQLAVNGRPPQLCNQARCTALSARTAPGRAPSSTSWPGGSSQTKETYGYGNAYSSPPTHVEKHLETLVAVVHQEGSVLPALTIGENLVLGDDQAAPASSQPKALRRRVVDAYEALGLPAPDPFALCSGLPPRRPQNPRSCSGVLVRRLALCCWTNRRPALTRE